MRFLLGEFTFNKRLLNKSNTVERLALNWRTEPELLIDDAESILSEIKDDRINCSKMKFDETSNGLCCHRLDALN